MIPNDYAFAQLGISVSAVAVGVDGVYMSPGGVDVPCNVGVQNRKDWAFWALASLRQALQRRLVFHGLTAMIPTDPAGRW